MVDDDLNITIIDWGLSTIQSGKDLTTYAGTPSYMAPEMIKHKHYDGRQTDLFSLGVMLY